MFGIMAALTAKLKLPNVQTPQPRLLTVTQHGGSVPKPARKAQQT